ncbi:hypothetical protein Tco_1011913 [Tanacetum coccineum]
MSDSEHSTVTYTSISSDYEEPSDLGSPGVVVYGYDRLPMHPPSSDYPAYLEFMPPEDDVFLTEEQPLPAAVSPTAELLGYITESDPREDPKEKDDEDPEEDPTDYPMDIYDDDDEEKFSGDDVDDEEEDESNDEEEEEHLAPADSVSPLAYRTTARMSIRAQIPIPFLSEAEIPSLPLPVSSPLPISPPLLPVSPTHPLGYRAAMIRLRAESPSTSHPLLLPPLIILPQTPPPRTRPLLPIPLPTSSPPLLLPSTDYRADVLKVTLPPRKRLCIAPGLRYKIRECSYAPIARPTGGFRADYGFVRNLDIEIRRDIDREIGYGITNVWEDPDEISEEIPATDVAELGQRMTDFVATVRQDTYEIYRRLDDA